MSIPQLTSFPDPPRIYQPEEEFDAKADEMAGHLPVLVNEINAMVAGSNAAWADINSKTTAATIAATTASNAATAASTSASSAEAAKQAAAGSAGSAGSSASAALGFKNAAEVSAANAAQSESKALTEFNFCYMNVLSTPATLAPTGKINGYDVAKSVYDTDVTVNLPTIEWDAMQKAWVRQGNPNLYTNFNYQNDLALYVNNVPTFFDIASTSSLVPLLDVSGLDLPKKNSTTTIVAGKRLYLLLKVSVGNSYSPHHTRRTFLDVSRFLIGQGGYTGPQLVAKNIAVDGYSWNNTYLSTALIPLTKNERRIDAIRIINNGVIDVRVVAWGFIYLHDDALL